MSPSSHGPGAEWLYADSPPYGLTTYHELQSLAESADVSVESLCQTVEIATHYLHESKTSFFDNDDLEAVVRALADDDFDFTDFDLETKVIWNEADHPRDPVGRFAQAQGTFPLSRLVTKKEEVETNNELENLHAIVKSFYPGLTSRWKGELKIRHYLLFGSLGAKDWECSISIALELLPHPAYRLSTLLHESLHALSPTTQEQYRKAPGWEEGVIEGATQLHQSQVAGHLGLSITSEQFEERNKDHSYVALVHSLESLRTGLKYTNKHAFYDNLMRLPATERLEFIRSEAQKLPPKDLESFRPVFRIHAAILDKYRSPKSSQSGETKGHDSTMTQDEVIATTLSARTLEEVMHAQEVLMDWMKDHPNDFKVLSGGEMLVMLAQAYGIENPALENDGVTINCFTGEVTRHQSPSQHED